MARYISTRFPPGPTTGTRTLLRRLQLEAVGRILPGLLLCAAVTAAAYGLAAIEAYLLGQAWLEVLVLAILLGTAVRMI